MLATVQVVVGWWVERRDLKSYWRGDQEGARGKKRKEKTGEMHGIKKKNREGEGKKKERT